MVLLMRIAEEIKPSEPVHLSSKEVANALSAQQFHNETWQVIQARLPLWASSSEKRKCLAAP